MQLDDELCLCFHVTKRKVINFIRIEQPKRAGQLSECFGAGTGCGWCRTYLTRLFDEAARGGTTDVDEPTKEDYARMRSGYVRQGGGTPPPGATPIDKVPEAGDAAGEGMREGEKERGGEGERGRGGEN